MRHPKAQVQGIPGMLPRQVRAAFRAECLSHQCETLTVRTLHRFKLKSDRVPHKLVVWKPE